MKFKLLVESEMINELSNDGKWVTFKNGHRTYIGDDGEIETGTLKGYNVNNTKAIKGKYKQLQDQANKKKKQEQKAKSREESKLTDDQKKGAKQVLSGIALDANARSGGNREVGAQIFKKGKEAMADALRKNKDSRDTSKATDKQYDSFANMVQHYGDYNEKSKKTQKKKAIKRAVKAMNR